MYLDSRCTSLVFQEIVLPILNYSTQLSRELYHLSSLHTQLYCKIYAYFSPSHED